MNTPNQKIFKFLLALAGGLVFALAPAAENSDVMSPTKRQLSLDQAKKLLAVREVSPTAAEHDPFHPAAFAELIAVPGRVPGVNPPSGETAASHAPAGRRPNMPSSSSRIRISWPWRSRSGSVTRMGS